MSGRVFLVSLVIFLDMLVALGVTLAALPFYVQSLGAGARGVGICVMVFSFFQALLTPVWGNLSDRIGRRTVAQIQLAGATVGMGIVALAPSFGFVVLGRAIAGTFGATNMLMMATISDVSSNEKRTSAMAIGGVALGLGGFVIGPAMGGALSNVSLRAPFVAATAIAFVNALAVRFIVPATSPASGKEDVRFDRASLARATKDIRVRGALLLHALFMMGGAAYNVCMALYAKAKFDLDARTVGMMLGSLGLATTVGQAGPVAWLAKRFGEMRVIVFGCTLLALTSATIVAAPSTATLFACHVIYGLAASLTIPCKVAVLTKGAPPELRGTALGVFFAVQSSVMVVFPPFYGSLFDKVSISAPLQVAAVMMAAMAFWGWAWSYLVSRRSVA